MSAALHHIIMIAIAYPTKLSNDIRSLRRLGWTFKKIRLHVLTAEDYEIPVSGEMVDAAIAAAFPKKPAVRKFKPIAHLWHLPARWRPALLRAVSNLGLEHLIEGEPSNSEIVQIVAEALMDGMEIGEDDVERILSEEMRSLR